MRDWSLTRFIYSELVQSNTWDTTANCKLQSGFSGEKCLEGELAHRGGGKIGNAVTFVVFFFLFFFPRLMRSGIAGKGNGINQIDMSGGGKMIRIMVNKAG